MFRCYYECNDCTGLGSEWNDELLVSGPSWCPNCGTKAEPYLTEEFAVTRPEFIEAITKVHVQRDSWPERESPQHAWHTVHGWLATLHGMDEDVATGRGTTPLKAIAELLWEVDREDLEPGSLQIVWE